MAGLRTLEHDLGQLLDRTPRRHVCAQPSCSHQAMRSSPLCALHRFRKPPEPAYESIPGAVDRVLTYIRAGVAAQHERPVVCPDCGCAQRPCNLARHIRANHTP